MGLLEELRAKSSAAGHPEAAAATARPQPDEAFRKALRPRFKALFSYLQELIQHLNRLTDGSRVSFDLPGNLTTPPLPLRHFAVTTDASDRMSEIRLRCEAVAERPFFIPAPTEKDAVDLAVELRRLGLVFAKRTPPKVGPKVVCLYEISPKVPILFIFKLDAERQGIHLTLRNYHVLGIRKEFFTGEEINEAWLDGVGRLVVHESDRLLLHTQSEVERRQIRHRLDSAKQEEQEEQLSEEEEAILRRKPRSAWEILFRGGKTR